MDTQASPMSKTTTAFPSTWSQSHLLDLSSWNNPLHNAAALGDLEAIADILEQGFPVDLENAQGRTPLHLAVEAKHVKAVQALLQHGADAGHDDDNEGSPMRAAVRLGSEQIVQLCLATNPKVKKLSIWDSLVSCPSESQTSVGNALANHPSILGVSDNRFPILHYFVSRQAPVSLIKLLIHAGADVNARDYQEATALHVAAQGSSTAIVRALLEAGADPNARDSKMSGTPLFGLASLGGSVENARLLLDYGGILHGTWGPGRTLLHLAAQDGGTDLVRLFVERGLNPNSQDETGAVAAKWAAQQGHLNTIQAMAKLGMDITHVDREGRSPLTSAALHGDMETVRFILDSGADPNEGGGVALSAALQHDHEPVAQLLIDYGARLTTSHFHDAMKTEKKSQLRLLELCRRNGAAASLLPPQDATEQLRLLMSSGQIEIATTIVNAGANISKLPSSFLSKISLRCAEVGYDQPFRALASAGVDRSARSPTNNWTAVHVAAEHGHLPVIQALRRLGWDMQAKTRFGRTALHIAAGNNHLPIVEELVSEIQLSVGDADGNTPLHFASESGNCQAIRLMLDAGAPVNKHNAGGWTPLHFACYGGHTEAVCTLIEAKADLVAQDITGNSALHFATRKKRLETMMALLRAGSDPNAVNFGGLTPLHIAAIVNAESIVKPLLEAGSDPNMCNHDGKVALELAFEADNFPLATTIVDHTILPSRYYITRAAFFRNSAELLILALVTADQSGMSADMLMSSMFPEALGELISTPHLGTTLVKALTRWLPSEEKDRSFFVFQLLLFVIKCGDDAELAQHLLSICPAVLKHCNDDNLTALHLACMYSRLSITRLFLGLGADPSVKLEKTGESCLSIAKKCTKESGIELLFHRCAKIKETLRLITLSRRGTVQPAQAS